MIGSDRLRVVSDELPTMNINEAHNHFSSFSKMSDLDNWKNYEDYDPIVPHTQQLNDEHDLKVTISLSVSLPVISLLLIGLVIRYRVKIKLKLSTWFTRIFDSIFRLFRNREDSTQINMDFRGSIPSIEFPESPSSVYPASSESIVSIPNRYLTTRPVHMIRNSAERRDRNVSRLIQRMFEVPLPQFEFADDSTYVSDPTNDILVSTPIPVAGRTFTVASPTPSPDSSVMGSNLDPAGLLETPIESDVNTIGIDDASVGSVLAIQDIQIRQQPARATRNRVPVYIDEPSDDEQ